MQALSDFFKAAAKTDQNSPLALDSIQLFLLTVTALRRELSSLWIAVAANFPATITAGSENSSQQVQAYASGVSECIHRVTSSMTSVEGVCIIIWKAFEA